LIAESNTVNFKHGEKIRVVPKDFSLEITKKVTLSCLDFSTSIPKVFLDGTWANGLDDQITEAAKNGKHFFVSIDTDGDYELDLQSSNGASLTCIHVRKNIDAHLIINGKSTGKHFSEIRMICDDDSNVNVIRKHPGSSLFETKKLHVMKNAQIEWKEMIHDGEYTRSHILADLLGMNARCDVNCGFVCKGNEKSDIYTIARHVGKGSKSNLVTKGIVLDRAQALSRGLIRIEKEASGSDGYEKQDTLVLSADAEADAIPNLEILNHNVTCSHGSTVGKIDEEKLFYLMSRGLNRKEAIKTIVAGYFSDMDELVEAAL